MAIEDSLDDAAPESAATDGLAELRERARIKKAAKGLGWKLIGRDTAEIRVERQFRFGPRTVIVRGRVPVALPAAISVEDGERALAPIVDPAAGKFAHAIDRAAAQILSAPDDVERKHDF